MLSFFFLLRDDSTPYDVLRTTYHPQYVCGDTLSFAQKKTNRKQSYLLLQKLSQTLINAWSRLGVEYSPR